MGPDDDCLRLCRHRYTRRLHWAYEAQFDLIRDTVWVEPKRFLFFKWQNVYGRMRLVPLRPEETKPIPSWADKVKTWRMDI